ncbi:MAG: glycosyltransferase family 1 protein [Patescibacteria group bacterium]
MKIGIDARLIRETGVGRYTSNLIKYLQRIDHKNDYVLFVRSQDLDEIKKWSMENGQWKMVAIDIPWHSIKEQVQFTEILNREKLDLVHFPYFSVPISYNRPFVITIHDLILHHYPTGKASTLPFPFYVLKVIGYKYLIRKASENAKKIIAVSKSTKDEIIDHLKIPQDKIKVIYEGVDDKITNQESRIASDQRPKTKDYFLFVGNVYPHKNAERMIKAFNIFLQYFPQTLLIIVGKEDFFYKRLRETVNKMDLGKKIIFYGRASDEELGVLYENAIAVVVPSLMEGFGLPALEAMANKCLVLASSIPSLKEVCREDAIYFDPYDIEDMAEKMKAAYQKDFDQKIIEKGFERTKDFSFRKMAKETLKIYEDAAK